MPDCNAKTLAYFHDTPIRVMITEAGAMLPLDDLEAAVGKFCGASLPSPEEAAYCPANMIRRNDVADGAVELLITPMLAVMMCARERLPDAFVKEFASWVVRVFIPVSSDAALDPARERILVLIESSGVRGMTMTEITRRTQLMRKLERDDAIQQLVKEKKIAEHPFHNGGRMGRLYLAVPSLAREPQALPEKAAHPAS
jgi:hypothetical protein